MALPSGSWADEEVTLILKQLSEAPGPSGRESAVREVLLAEIREHVHSCRVDSMGNLIALKKGTGAQAPSPRVVMLSAHMDEVGLMVVHIDKDGLLAFKKIGGIDDRVLLSKRVLVGENRIPGVIGCKPVHLLSKSEREKVVSADDMAIDIGATSREAAEKLVKLGDYAVFDTQYELLSDGRVAKGKAFDDRAGCVVVAELLKGGPYPFDLYGVFTVQEEVGLRGARVAAYALEPDLAIALEGTVCDDSPKKRDVSPTTQMGKGPAISIMDRSVVADRRLVKLLATAAAELGIPYQYKQPGVGGTDSGAIHLAKEGVPTGVVSVPARYIHSPVCLLSLEDLDNTIQLMQAALDKLADLDLGGGVVS